MTRVQVILDEDQRERFREAAAREGKSLSTWLREAGIARAEASESRTRIETVDDLRRFFAECDAHENGREPEWEQHLVVIGDSKKTGLPDE